MYHDAEQSQTDQQDRFFATALGAGGPRFKSARPDHSPQRELSNCRPRIFRVLISRRRREKEGCYFQPYAGESNCSHRFFRHPGTTNAFGTANHPDDQPRLGDLKAGLYQASDPPALVVSIKVDRAGTREARIKITDTQEKVLLDSAVENSAANSDLNAILKWLSANGYASRLAGIGHARGCPRASLRPRPARCSTAAIDESALGRRDYALIITLLRLGLRRSEVARLRLDDIDWRAAEVVVRGKGAREDRLPLPVDVGEAIAAYLRRGRRATDRRELFLRARAPYEPIASATVASTVRRACRRAGIAEVGAHRLRHTTACEMISAGVPLVEIAQVLRHHSLQTTAVYARVDLDRLRRLAAPWPGGAQR